MGNRSWTTFTTLLVMLAITQFGCTPCIVSDQVVPIYLGTEEATNPMRTGSRDWGWTWIQGPEDNALRVTSNYWTENRRVHIGLLVKALGKTVSVDSQPIQLMRLNGTLFQEITVYSETSSKGYLDVDFYLEKFPSDGAIIEMPVVRFSGNDKVTTWKPGHVQLKPISAALSFCSMNE